MHLLYRCNELRFYGEGNIIVAVVSVRRDVGGGNDIFALVLFHENCTNRPYRVFGIVFEAGAVGSGCGCAWFGTGSGFGLAF